MMVAVIVILTMMTSFQAMAVERGMASTYCDRETSTGKMHCKELTVAHRTLPFGTRVLIQNRWNRKWVIATVTDRGMMCDQCPPAMKARVRARIIDLSSGTAAAIGSDGLVLVVVVVLINVSEWM